MLTDQPNEARAHCRLIAEKSRLPDRDVYKLARLAEAADEANARKSTGCQPGGAGGAPVCQNEAKSPAIAAGQAS